MSGYLVWEGGTDRFPAVLRLARPRTIDSAVIFAGTLSGCDENMRQAYVGTLELSSSDHTSVYLGDIRDPNDLFLMSAC